MKAIKQHLKQVALILSMLILFQGCTIYKSTPVSIDEASRMDNAVRVITTNNEKLKYDKIIKENGSYYSVKKERTADVIAPIDALQIKEVKVKDKTATGILTLVSIPLVIGLLVYGAFAIWPPAINIGSAFSN